MDLGGPSPSTKEKKAAPWPLDFVGLQDFRLIDRIGGRASSVRNNTRPPDRWEGLLDLSKTYPKIRGQVGHLSWTCPCRVGTKAT